MLHLQIAGNNLKEPLCSTCIYLFLPKITIFLNFVLNCYLAAPQPTLGHYRQDSLTHPMLITAFYIFNPVVTRNFIMSLISLVECLVEFEPRTFRFLLQCLNWLGHSPHKWFTRYILLMTCYLSWIIFYSPSYS